MLRFIKIFLFLFILVGIGDVYAQQPKEMFKQKKERKRLWRRWSGRERHNATPYNPYIEKSKANKPSSRIGRGEAKEIRKQRRDYRKQMRKGQKKTQE